MEIMSDYSCKKASEMVEKKKLFGLSFIERLKLKWHLTACGACSAYEKQSELIDQAISKNSSNNDIKLSAESKEQIISSLKK